SQQKEPAADSRWQPPGPAHFTPRVQVIAHPAYLKTRCHPTRPKKQTHPAHPKMQSHPAHLKTHSLLPRKFAARAQSVAPPLAAASPSPARSCSSAKSATEIPSDTRFTA